MTDKDKDKDTKLAKLSPEGEAVLALADIDERFKTLYGAKLKMYSETVPTRRGFEVILDKLMGGENEELAFSLNEVLSQTQGNKIGMFATEERTVFPELRVFHGVGNDVNRPDGTQIGHFYFNTKENVGESFVGAIIAIWKGRTMWGDRAAGESTAAPLCQSMDRKVGNVCGDCSVCPDRPWRDGEKTRCSDDVVAFMLTRNFKRLIMVRFAKTSTKTGNQLYRNISIGANPWSKWWKLTLEKQKNELGQWYNIIANPAGEEEAELYTPEVIDEFCTALCNNLSAAYILPGIAQTYKQSAQETPTKEADEQKGSGDVQPASPDDVPTNEEEAKDDEGKYGEMPPEGNDDTPNM